MQIHYALPLNPIMGVYSLSIFPLSIHQHSSHAPWMAKLEYTKVKMPVVWQSMNTLKPTS